MISIDGSAGGQVLRTALAFSVLLQKAVKVFNIRANRPNPGLQAQHLTAIKTLKELTSANVQGAAIRSKEIIFEPGEINEMQLNVNIGTAGSITLLLQSILLPSLLKEIKLRITGGTDVAWSPPFNYMKEVLLPVLAKMGARYELDLNNRGYYPKGLGSTSFKSTKANLPLKPVNLTELGQIEFIRLFSHSASLPKEVSLNQAVAARNRLEKLNVNMEEKIEWREKSATVGSGIDLIAFFSSGVKIGANALGAKGKPAIDVGKEAAEKLQEELGAATPVDSHLADQLIPFMGIAEGTSLIRCSRLTDHAINNIKVTEIFLETKFIVDGERGKPTTISVNGAGLKK